jgi:oligopeptidase A
MLYTFFVVLVSLSFGTKSIVVYAFNVASRTYKVEADLDNAWLQQEGLPKFSRIKPHHLTPAVEGLLEKLQLELNALENSLLSKRDVEYDFVMPKVERIKFNLEYIWRTASHLNAVSNAKELREAYELSQAKVVMALAAFSQSKPLYSALLNISGQIEKISDDEPESFLLKQKRRAVSKLLLEMKHGGVGLDNIKKIRLNELKLRLVALSTSYSNNILDGTQSFSVTIYHSRKLRGVPESAKAQWHNAHRRHISLLSGSPKEYQNEALDYFKWGENGPLTYEEVVYEQEVGNFGWSIGPWRITLDQPSYLAAMMHISDRGLRKQIHLAYVQRASEICPTKNNIPLIHEILGLKQEMAIMLGYKNYAELSLSSKTASSVESITQLTNLVAKQAIPVAQKELAEITAFARERGGEEYAEDQLKSLEPWDILYWTERLKESKFDLTEEELRPYFSLPNVLKGLFNLLNRLFDVSVEAAQGYVEKWHSDVMFYNIYDNKSGSYVASFYLDPYSRPMNKRGGAWMSSCVGKSSAVDRDYPVAYVTCDLQPPHKETPSLMNFREVTTLWHEMGHAFQHLLTTATVGDVSGINGIEVRPFTCIC